MMKLESFNTAGISIRKMSDQQLKPLECFSGSCSGHLLRSMLKIVSFIFIFALKIHFYVKMKIRETISNDLNKCYSGHDPEQHSKVLIRVGKKHVLNVF